MKFLLIMQVCSALHLSCMDEMTAGEYKTHFDCATAGYLNSIGVLQSLDVDSVNENKLVVNFKCYPQSDI